MFRAYERVFSRCGLRFRPVEAESGAIGGSYSHEFMVLAETGEEGVVSCASCGYAANVERAELPAPPPFSPPASGAAAVEEVPTPQASSVEALSKLLSKPPQQFIKALILLADENPVVVLIRGDHELNEAKLQRYLHAERIVKANEATYTQVSGSPVGFAGPLGLKARMLADHAVGAMQDAVAGANKKDAHLLHVVPGRDFTPEAYVDLRKAAAGDPCPRCARPMEYFRGIEVGHTFKLGVKYSSGMKATFLDPQGKAQPFIMGCYGIGVSRIIAACIEQCHDAQGIIWPAALAPWEILIVGLNSSSNESVKKAADELYEQAQRLGLDVLLDDRDESAGVKLKDADLLGLPFRLVVGDRKLKEGKVEFKRRSAAAAQDLSLAEAIPVIQEILAKSR